MYYVCQKQIKVSPYTNQYNTKTVIQLILGSRTGNSGVKPVCLDDDTEKYSYQELKLLTTHLLLQVRMVKIVLVSSSRGSVLTSLINQILLISVHIFYFFRILQIQTYTYFIQPWLNLWLLKNCIKQMKRTMKKIQLLISSFNFFQISRKRLVEFPYIKSCFLVLYC